MIKTYSLVVNTVLCIVATFSVLVINGQNKVYEIDASNDQNNLTTPPYKIIPHPNAINQFGANNQYFLKDGKPWMPIMGEFHYVRYPEKYWEEEIVKMKSAGLSIVATYVFWNAHEYPKGRWDWSGDKNLKKFIKLCEKHQMYVWLRIGPWSHGEQLYGGHPEWIHNMRGKRSNSPEYLNEAEQLFKQIGKQTDGLYLNEGGPIIGVQLENEYASGQAAHIDSLRSMALRNEIIPAYFSITANTVFNDKEYGYFPLQGAYPYRGWTKSGGGPTKDFLYGNDQWILGDALGKLYYNPEMYPKGLCEQGAGSQMKYKNRFVVEPHVVEAHLQNQLGRGMNLIGYYMFHGGIQLPGLKEPGYPESYDFQAPLSEFGFPRSSYQNLKILHHFVNDFGNELATMGVVYPELPVSNELNTDSLRYVVRIKENTGFLFLGNTQVRIPMPDKEVQIGLKLSKESIQLPRTPFTLKGETTAILPFNIQLNNVLLKYATAQPVSKIDQNGNLALFLMELESVNTELAFDKNTVKNIEAPDWHMSEEDNIVYLNKKGTNNTIVITDNTNKKLIIQLLDRNQALKSWRVSLDDQEYFVIADADLLQFNDKIELRKTHKPDFGIKVYPDPSEKIERPFKFSFLGREGIFYHYETKLDSQKIDTSDLRISKKELQFRIPERLPENCSDLIMKIDYQGGDLVLKINDTILTDNLYNGTSWKVGLKRYIDRYPDAWMTIEMKNLSSDNFINSDEFKGKQGLSRINDVQIYPEYSFDINLNLD
ncbi:beta-galactosidase [Zhouia spongiae]|uniref:Beta-galactosidase n=1 Tax=Zhouia spongiae TaxID=2202721 RepID=A0ABY3YJ95_9FLAO|nr:beta-galactosidase [Zhouia spongiae]UNY97233.1 beta-galactosidase [Zhouia spongiae]